ncbi:MAG: hypothetical protein R3E42_02390 [Burkholderiaceae bacterium]
MKTTLSHPPVTLERGQMWPPQDSRRSGLWQVEQGMLLVQCPTTLDPGAWHLALPGDCLDLASACGLGGGVVRVTALLPSRLGVLSTRGRMSRERLLGLLVAQQQRWMSHLLALRSGPVERRIRHLLGLARLAAGGAGAGRSTVLPVLRDMAALVDAVPETVCRVLTRLQPHDARRRSRAAAVALT